MKKSYVKWILLFVFTISIISSVFFVIKRTIRTTYVLPPEISLAIFGCEPSEFAYWELDIYSSTEDFREKAFVDVEGNLVLRLNEQQKEAFRNKNWGISVDYLRKSENIQIAKDYTQVTILGYKETIVEDLTNIAFGYSSFLIEQLLTGKEPSTISVEFIIKDGVTGKTVYSVVAPGEAFSFGSKDYEFSSKFK